MKNSFSTLGCPNWSFTDIITTAKDIKMDGIEVRGMGNQMYAPKLPIFSIDNIDNTIQKMKKLNLEFSIITSGCDLSDDNWNENFKEAKEYIMLAQKLGCSYVRIMCESTPEQRRDIDINIIASRYKEICIFAKGTNVFPLIETNSILANSDTMLEFLDLVSMDNAYVLWDIHHPFRFFNELPKTTYSKLKTSIKYIHIKDSINNNGNVEYKMTGYGDVPIFDCLKLLYDNDYSSWISLEWTLRWNPDLEDSGIVIPHYAGYIHELENRLST